MSDQVAQFIDTDDEYQSYLSSLQLTFEERKQSVLFRAQVDNLWDLYLAGFPDSTRQHYNCRTCRQFIERFGDVVSIDEQGAVRSVLWDPIHCRRLMADSVRLMRERVDSARVLGAFFCDQKMWGNAVTNTKGQWNHLAVIPSGQQVYRPRVLSADQAMAAKLEDYKTVKRAMGEWSQAVLEQAVKLLKTDSLYRSEKILGQAEWLLDLSRKTNHSDPRRHQTHRNLTWLAIATAPDGFCHPRSSMIGTLLDDIASGMDFNEVSRRFSAKMHPLQYQRPQAAPATGAIEQAEKLVEKLGIARSLERRFCAVEETSQIWRSKPVKAEESQGGVFGHLKAKSESVPDMVLPPIKITFDKFRHSVLPDAEKIEVFADSSRQRFGVLVTSVHADSPPIHQWDKETDRNPVSWYFWHGGSLASEFGLRANQYHAVSGICLNPCHWRDESAFEHQGKFAMFLMDGIQESRQSGNALFPETLKAELHGVRAVVEAYSKQATIAEIEAQLAAGLVVDGKTTSDPLLARVTSNGLSVQYKIDRWD